MTFGAPTYLISRWMRLRERRLELDAKTNKLLVAMREENRLLEERVESLESVVMDADYELNQKLRNLELSDGAKVTQTRSLPRLKTSDPAAKDESSS